MYMAIIRSQIQYGLGIIGYNDKELDEMQKEQFIAIKKILKLDYRITEETAMLVSRLPYIQDRAKEVSVKFFYKLVNKDNNSMASKIFKECRKIYMPTTDLNWTNRISPTNMINKALEDTGHRCTFDLSDQYSKKIINQMISKSMAEYKHTRIESKLENQHTRYVSDKYRAQAPSPDYFKEDCDFSLCNHFKYNKGINIKVNHDYIPNLPYDYMTNVTKTLSGLDNNLKWFSCSKCKFCNGAPARNTHHKLFGCKAFSAQRKLFYKA